jgi:hypothetical protein
MCNRSLPDCCEWFLENRAVYTVISWKMKSNVFAHDPIFDMANVKRTQDGAIVVY